MTTIRRLEDRATGEVGYYIDEHVDGGQLLGPAYATREAAEAAQGAMMSSTEILRLICAWCGVVLREAASGARTSHGICAACEQRMREAERA